MHSPATVTWSQLKATCSMLADISKFDNLNACCTDTRASQHPFEARRLSEGQKTTEFLAQARLPSGFKQSQHSGPPVVVAFFGHLFRPRSAMTEAATTRCR
jgi:hypothetical protein